MATKPKRRLTLSAQLRVQRKKKIIKLRESGMTFEAIADEMGMSAAGVGVVYRKYLAERDSV